MSQRYPTIPTFLVLITSLTAGSLLMGCAPQQDENCLEYRHAPVVSTKTPARGSMAQPIPIEVVVAVNNGCGQFDSYYEETEGNTRTLMVSAAYQGCICTQNIPLRSFTYTFNPTKPGTYYLRFWQAPNQFLTDTIVVE